MEAVRSTSQCGVSSEECDGEDEESSSILLNNLTINSLQEENNDNSHENIETELLSFRQQWQIELDSPSKSNVNRTSGELKNIECNTSQFETDEEKAKRLFLKGVEYERNGELYEAIKFYKKAVQLVPDIEIRLYENTKLESSDEPFNNIKSKLQHTNMEKSETSSDIQTEDHLSRIEKIVLENGYICAPENENEERTHISSLPNELILYILRWIVSNELDMISLERFASVCRGFYTCARDSKIWKLACVRIWGIHCGSYENLGFTSWRHMFIGRPKLKFNGCYISKTSYVRAGENSFQDQFYRPWHLVNYFRYLRFFPDGVVLMITTADEPVLCLDKLKQRNSNIPGVYSGHYRLKGNKVAVIISKPYDENKQIQSSKNRPKRKDSPDITECYLRMEFKLNEECSNHLHPLHWHAYSIVTTKKFTGFITSTSFEMVKSKFPPFKFHQVNRYHAKAEHPLQ